MAELADALDLGSSGATRAGSIPVSCTTRLETVPIFCTEERYNIRGLFS